MALNPNIGWHPPTRTRQPATGPQAQYRWPSEVRILILAPAVFQHRGDTITEAEKALLDELHLRKIDLADAMFVVDPGGYIGESTTREIGYARSTGKPIFRLSVVRDRYTERR